MGKRVIATGAGEPFAGPVRLTDVKEEEK